MFELKPQAIGAIIRGEHPRLVEELEQAGIAYAEVRNALVPRSGRYELAFVFDSERAGSANYGYSFAELWVPILKLHGPQTTALRVGDIQALPHEFVWGVFDRQLVGPADFPRQRRELYFVVYVTNLSSAQLRNVHDALAQATGAYLGYVDCSTWTPLKAGLFLPQVGLRIRNRVITTTDEQGYSNLPGYPYEESDFEIVGISDELYSLFLTHRIDNGVPEWAGEDSAMALTALGGQMQAVATTEVVIDDERITYLSGNHDASLGRAGLARLDRESLAVAIGQKFTNGLIYNIRFVPGARNGVPVSELDALMYSVQVEFPDGLQVKRYQVGLKYTPNTHVSEVVTFY